MRLFLVVGLLGILSACTTGYPLKSVDYNDLFTDGNSKVWLVNKMLVGDVDVAEHILWNKSVLIFHNSGTVDYISLKAMGQKAPRKGKFYLDSDDRVLNVEFKGESWWFDIPVLEENKIILKPKKKSDVKFKLELIPLPQL